MGIGEVVVVIVGFGGLVGGVGWLEGGVWDGVVVEDCEDVGGAC